MQINRKLLIAELKWIRRFAPKKTTIPILSHVLFEVDGKRLTLTATDLETAGVTVADGAGRGHWSVTAPVTMLANYLDKVDEDEVSLSADETHRLIVTHGAASRMVTAGMSKESYPELPAAPEPIATLSRLPLAIERVGFAISKEESRFTLNGALLEVKNGAAHLIATDGHRLSRAPIACKGAEKIRALIPKFALMKVGDEAEECRFAADDSHLFFSWPSRRIITRKLTGKFPDWERVMGDSFANHIILPVKTTLKTLTRVAVCAGERSRAVRFTVEGDVLTIFASSVETGEASGAVAGKRGEGVTPLVGGYNANYVSEFLSNTEAQNVAFCWQADDKPNPEDANPGKVVTGGQKAAMFTTSDFWAYILMPMKI